ncbi:FecCD family ABC transporter permease [Salisediminibacterium beveridgei]|uniref:Vitamin B12 ABC transporter, permease component BtuC n=1 Tax=Salisediminibacterium beveridgei TaxID=632773 RepID=A0A1D7QXU0_9BACI|nr:iron ABC transporter permease [Salisediminibacterium beveridgei]AOM83822.1 Vitamin B12 ABC transporter, permease component BtuC [Salisediminibacterium beveridgei]
MFTIGAVLLSLSISSVHVPLGHIAHIVGENLFGLQPNPEITDGERRIIWNIRLPRVFLGLGVGAALALAGAAFQGLLRNPLADPYTIGVSSGASLGAVIVIFFGISLPVIGGFTLPLMAILFGFATLMIVFGLVQLTSRSLAVETIILAGIIMSAFIGALISLLIALGDQDAMTRIIYWLYGSVALRGWSYVQLLVPFLVTGSLMLLVYYRELNAMALGEEAAGHIGVNVRRGKIVVVAGASLLTGAAVAVSGTIGFVGLVIPHLVRLLTGPNHRHVLPISFITGGGFLVFADLLARTIIAPQEMPIGVLTALIGAPVFALLLIRKRLGKE